MQYLGPGVPRKANNLKSDRTHPKIVKKKINKDSLDDRGAGPFVCKLLHNLITSPNGFVPKKGEPNEYRMKDNLSNPSAV